MWRRREIRQTVITHRSVSQRRAQVEVGVSRPSGLVYVCVFVITVDSYVCDNSIYTYIHGVV